MSLPFVLGTDIIRTSRLANKSPRWLVRFAKRILHPAEIMQLKNNNSSFQSFHEKHWHPSTQHHQILGSSEGPNNDLDGGAKHPDTSSRVDTCLINLLAGRWAAKEAARKAWGAEIIGFRDVRITRKPHQSPKIICQLLGDYSNTGWHDTGHEGLLSISHDGEYAVATVIAAPLSEDLEKTFRDKRRAVKGIKVDQMDLLLDNEQTGN